MKPMSRVLLSCAFVVGAGVLSVQPASAADDRWTAHLSASQEVPTNASRAQGQLLLSLSEDGTTLDYRLVFANLENPVAAHIHLAPAGLNGPVVAFLFGPTAPGEGRTNGVVATGTITAANLVGPLAGQPLSALVDAIESGGAYVNAHTNDGVPPVTNEPGDIPGGEIRGQLG